MTTSGLGADQWVKHPKRPEWGVGEILQRDGDCVRVIFEHEGEKKLDTRYVTLDIADHAPSSRSKHLTVIPDVDMEKVTAACLLFHDDMKDNRERFDDGGMALAVLDDMKKDSRLTLTTARRLFAWCHTDGPVFQRGVDLAQRICTLIYGRVPSRDEARLLRR